MRDTSSRLTGSAVDAVDELAPRLVERRAVDQDQDVGVGVAEDLHAADADPLDGAVVDDIDTRDPAQRLGEAAVAEAAQLIGGDDGDRAGDGAERLLALGGADDDVLLRRGRAVDADLGDLLGVTREFGERWEIADRNAATVRRAGRTTPYDQRAPRRRTWRVSTRHRLLTPRKEDVYSATRTLPCTPASSTASRCRTVTPRYSVEARGRVILAYLVGPEGGEMPSRRRGIARTKLIIATVLLLALAIGGNSFYGLRTLYSLSDSYADARRAEHEQAMKRETELVVRNVGLTAALPLGESNYTYLQNLAKSTVDENRNLAWIVVADSMGNKVVARTDKAPAGDKLEDELSAKLRSAQTSTDVQQQRSARDPNHIVFGANITVGDQRVGEVRLSLDISELETAHRKAIEAGRDRGQRVGAQPAPVRRHPAAGRRPAQLLAGPPHHPAAAALSQKARTSRSGDFGQRVEVSSSDEIGQLAESFNMMAESLGMLVEEIARKASLEREVELARTIQGLMTPPPTCSRSARSSWPAAARWRRAAAATGGAIASSPTGACWW